MFPQTNTLLMFESLTILQLKMIFVTKYILIFLCFFVFSLSQCGDNCIECETSQNICVICKGVYELNVLGQCKRGIVDKCIVYGSNNECLRCQQMHSLAGGKCIKNYDGCINDDGQGNCMQCGFGTKLRYGKCQGIVNCIAGEKQCQKCTEGYNISSSGICKDISLGCSEIRADGVCLTCKEGYFMSGYRCFLKRFLNQKCYILQTNTTCLYCKSGYNLYNGSCLLFHEVTLMQAQSKRKQSISPLNINALPQNIFDSSTSFTTRIVRVPYSISNPGSNTTRIINIPISIIGLSTKNSTKTINQSMLNCLQKSGKTCKKCSLKYYLNPEGICVPTNPLCRTSNARGQCTSCFFGYTLKNYSCNLEQKVNKFCKKWNNQSCLECYVGFYLNNDKICKAVNPLCKTYNSSGNCLSCYNGYSLNENMGSCLLSLKDPNCRSYISSSQDVCTKCSLRFYLGNNGLCTSVNINCKDYNINNGACTTCYPGFKLVGKNCIPGSDQDINCNEWNGQICKSCIKGYYISNNNSCKIANSYCKEYDGSNGNCLSCYPGYDLVPPSCINTTKDKNCKKFDNSNKTTCIQCFKGHFNHKGICIAQNSQCKTITSNGKCASCWDGYQLYEEKCFLSEKIYGDTNENPFCFKFENTVCIQCIKGYFLSRQNQKCIQADPYCLDLDQNTNNCLRCAESYTLQNFKCVFSYKIEIPHCYQINSNGLCQQCIQGYYLFQRECKKVPIECLTYDKITGQCLTCIDQYFYQDGVCIFPGLYDVNCIRYESSYCSICKDGYYLLSYMCNQIDKDCQNFNKELLVCEACSNNKYPNGPDCM